MNRFEFELFEQKRQEKPHLVFQVEHLLLALVARLVAGDTAAFIPQFAVTRIESRTSTVLPSRAGAE
jgi:hypothetical protein